MFDHGAIEDTSPSGLLQFSPQHSEHRGTGLIGDASRPVYTGLYGFGGEPFFFEVCQEFHLLSCSTAGRRPHPEIHHRLSALIFDRMTTG